MAGRTPMRRQAAVTDARTGTTTYEYNAGDQVIAVTAPDPDGAGPESPQTTRHTYDIRGRQAQVTLPDGGTVLFVGTKRQARKAVQDHADRVGMHWVNDRWLGGTLTNFATIKRSIARLKQIEKMEADGTINVICANDTMQKLEFELECGYVTFGGIKKDTTIETATTSFRCIVCA